MRTSSCILALLVLSFSFAFAQESRTWTDATGKFETRGELVEQTDTTVTLRLENGKTIDVPIDKLSSADQKYLQALATKPAPIDPGPKADFSLDVIELIQAYEKDERAASAKFGGKIVEVKGKLFRYRVGFFRGDNYLQLVLSDHHNDKLGPDATFFRLKDSKAFRQAAAGSIVTVKGKINQYHSLGFDKHPWQITSTDGEPTLEFTAPQFAERFAKEGADKLREALQGKVIVVKGKLAAIAPEKPLDIWLVAAALKGSGGRDIGVHLSSQSDKHFLKDKKIGDELAIIGEAEVVRSPDEGAFELGLTSAYFLDSIDEIEEADEGAFP